jgi:hypothetical protein
VIEHIVVFKWKAEASQDDINSAIAGLRGLKAAVPGIVDLTVGENFSSRNQGFHCGLVVRFVDRDALESYVPHLSHQSVVQNLLNPIREESIVIDYEIDR